MVTDRIVNQFLCYLDGVEGRDGVFVMAATSRPDLVDVALLRPGRIDKAVLCGFPDVQDRTDIIKLYLKKFNFVGTDLFAAELAKQTNNFTSADPKTPKPHEFNFLSLKSLLVNAVFVCFRSYQQAGFA